MEGKEVWEQFGDEGNVEQDPLVENDGARHTNTGYPERNLVVFRDALSVV